MQLKLARNQKTKGMMSKSVVFMLDARAEYTPEETANIRKYGLGNQVIYNSATSTAYLEKGRAALSGGTFSGVASSMVSLAMSKLSLNITIDSLGRGQHIETESIDELLGAEEAIMAGCQNAKAYLAAAETFDGAERVVEI
jgi:hypothetical protein